MPQPNTISILIVDDDPAILDSFKIILEREPGYVVSAVETGTDALDLLDTQYFDVIISDYAMPDIDGVTLLREVRARGC
jgi:CheY-like chemotaxis protein